MFNKLEFFSGVIVALIAGVGIGYSKARERCMAAMAEGLIKDKELKEEQGE